MAHGTPLTPRGRIQDVAKAAGVSVMTVSRVANDLPGVGPSTRDRVKRIMSELGYVPNASARALKTGKARSLGLLALAGEMHGPLTRTLGAIEHGARDNGYSLLIASYPEIDKTTIAQATEQFQRDSVGAVIAISPLNDSSDSLAYLASRIPTVGIWTPAGPVDSIAARDNEAGAAIATEHLLDLGHETVWHVGGPKGWMATDHREAGWRTALEKAGRPIPDAFSGDDGPPWSAESGYNAGIRLLANPLVDAVFVADDRVALGFLRAAHQAGRRIPHDLAVIGYDDIPEAAYYSPALTTIHEDFELLGFRAVELALSRLGDRDTETESPIPHLVRRETTSAPRS